MTERIPDAVFIASAGTGKTHQVTELYKALILEGEQYPPEGHGLDSLMAGQICPPELVMPCHDIVMLTFARDAGAEMRTRITRKIEEMAAIEDRGLYWDILRSLAGATISTIHSFAQSLLKENALLAGISPAVSVLEGDAADAFLESAESVLLACLKSPDHPAHDLMRQLCQLRGADEVLARIEMLHRNLLSRGCSLAEMEDVSSLIAEAILPGYDELVSIAEHMKPLLEDASGRTNAGKFMKMFEAWLDQHPQASQDDILAACTAWNGDVSKSWSSNGKYPDFDTARLLIRQAVSRALGREAAELLRHFMGLARECALAYKEYKHRAGLLDFDDLLLKALQLLKEHPERAPRCRVIIVDEAQDNSRVQNQVILALREATRASLVICGDRKQSIHTWRAADPTGMQDMQALLEEHLPIALTRSYRSQDDLVAWINSMSRHETVLGRSYDEQAALKSRDLDVRPHGPNVELLLPDWEYHPDTPDERFDIEFSKEVKQKPRWLLTKADLKKLNESDDSDDWARALLQHEDRHILEAMAVARRIKLLVESDDDQWRPAFYWDESTSTWQKSAKGSFRYRDVMILLRATTRQEYYESAMRELGIQFTTGGKGRGFYFRQEVKDISSLLSWLANQRDRLALLAVLRSPLVGFSDSAIALLMEKAKGADRRDSVASGNDLSRVMLSTGPRAEEFVHTLDELGLDADAECYLAARDVLRSLKALAGRVPVVELVREAVKLTGYDAVLAGHFHGAQALANLQKLLTLLQETDYNNSLSLTEMANWLRKRISEENSPDAVVSDPEDDAVRISTAHSSKGLTSRIIFIPDLRYEGMSDTRRLIPYDRKEGLAVAADFEEPAAGGETGHCTTWDYEEVKELAKKERDEESRRLFYVAITRARSLVVLSGETPSRSSAWRSWINEWMLSQKSTDEIDQLVRRRSYAEIKSSADFQQKSEWVPITAKGLAGAMQAFRPIQAPDSWRLPVTALVKVPADNPDALLEYRRTSLVGLSAGTARGHGEEDHDNADQAMDAVPDELNEQSDSEPPITRSALSIGTAAHDVLERLDYSDLKNGGLKQQAMAMGFDKGLLKSLLPRVDAVASHLAPDMGDAETVIRELPFVARFDHEGAVCLIDGKIDLLYLIDGCWHIVDYKFSNANASKLLATYAMQLQIYQAALREWGDSFELTLLGCSDQGQITAVSVPSVDPAKLSADVIYTARLLESQMG
jgi:ATP-dependent exoDNAse (exonuclease V) beta subunit